ncbi:zinc knuckle CX2CX4HX4C containing protein [Tanacetum coccineum]
MKAGNYAGKTHVDLVSSSLHVSSVPGTANVVDLFGVPLNTVGDIDNLNKDIELGKYEVWLDFPSEKCTKVMDTIWAMWDAFVAENPNVTSGYSSDSGKSDPLESRVKGSTNIDDTIHVDESPIVQSIIVQDMPNSYAGAAGGLKPVPSKSKAKFRSLFLENLCEGASFSIPKKVVEMVSTRFANTLYGYFIGKRMAFPVVEYYVWNNWGKYGLTRIMMNSKGFFFFQFKTSKGLEDVLENGPWMIHNSPIILKKWTMNTRLCKEELTRIPVWVKIHDVPIQGRSSFAQCLIEISTDDVLKESLTMGVPLIKGSGFTIEIVTIEYEWKPPRCDLCKIFGHVHNHYPKTVSVSPSVVTHNAVTPNVKKTNDGFQTMSKKKKKGKSKSTNGGQVGGHLVKQTIRYEPKASTSVPKKGATNLGNASKLSSMSYVFSEDGLSIIASQIGKPIMFDSYTSSMCIESRGRSSFAQCLIEINTDDVLKESLTMGVPLIKGSGFTIETVSIEYKWKPPRCDLCKIFGHVHDHCPKTVSVSPSVVTHNAVTPNVKKTNEGFQTVSKKKKKGKSKSTNGGQVGGHLVKQTVRYEPKASTSVPKKGATNLGNASKSSSMSKNQSLKATVTSTKEGNITMSNSYAALDDESKEDVENVYDESANLLHSLKTGGSSSTFTAVVG